MLKKTIMFENNLPFLIDFCNIYEENFHWHNELEMALVLRGNTTYTIHHLDYHLSEGDVLIVDGDDLHRIKDSSKDILILRIHVDLQYFSEQYPHIYFMIFACEDCSTNSAAKKDYLKNKVTVLRKQLCKTADAWLREPDNRALQLENINEFIFLLVNHFQSFFIENKKFKTKEDGTNKVNLERVYHIFEYIYTNHSKKVTLKEIGELENLSPYYISHLIKETTGINFQDFLGYLRVELAQKMLLESNQALTYISESCGFSSLNYFNKCFKYWHGTTPAEFRKNYKPCRKISYGTINSNDAHALLLSYLGNQLSEDSTKPLHLFIDPDRYKKTGENFSTCYSPRIMICSAKELIALSHLLAEIESLGKYRLIIRPSAINELHDLLGPETASICLKKLKQAKIEPETAPLDFADGSPLINLPPAKNVSEAFIRFNENANGYVTIFGSEGSLFTETTFRTPYYYLFSTLAKVNGKLIYKEDSYFIVQSDSSYFVGIFHHKCKETLHVHITFRKNAVSVIIKNIFDAGHNCFDSAALLDYLDLNDEKIHDIVEKVSAGETSIFTPDNSDREDFTFDTNVSPESFALFEFHI